MFVDESIYRTQLTEYSCIQSNLHISQPPILDSYNILYIKHLYKSTPNNIAWSTSYQHANGKIDCNATNGYVADDLPHNWTCKAS